MKLLPEPSDLPPQQAPMRLPDLARSPAQEDQGHPRDLTDLVDSSHLFTLSVSSACSLSHYIKLPGSIELAFSRGFPYPQLDVMQGNRQEIVLASSSPRRAELLRQ